MAAAVRDATGLAMPDGGDLATLPERIAGTFLARMESSADDPLLALIRSAATNEPSAMSLYRQLRHRSVRSLQDAVPQANVDSRSDLIVASLIGLAFSRYVMRTGRLAQLDVAAVERHLASMIRHILEPSAE
jgi:hypothetical protein